MDLSLLSFLSSPIIWIKIITVIVIGFYTIFTFIVFTQVKVMAQIIRLPYAEATIKSIALMHVALAISLFIAAIVIL